MAIFLTKVAYIGIQIPYWAILKNVDIKVKPDVATFGATFGKYWSTFNSIIWPHLILNGNQLMPKGFSVCIVF